MSIVRHMNVSLNWDTATEEAERKTADPNRK